MPKIYAACGAAGFALSFIVSIFSGAPILLVLVRALVFGAVFAGLAALFNFLLRRFVPDLFDKSAAPAPAPAPSPKPKARGGKLDITISDEGEAPSEDDDFSVPDFMKDRSRGKGAAASASAAPVAKEDAAESAPAGESANAETAPARDEEKPAMAAPDSAHDLGAAGGGGLADMPDASEFVEEDEFGGGLADEDDSTDSEPPPPPRRSPSPSASASASGVDAETMAKAIRTVLSKGD